MPRKKRSRNRERFFKFYDDQFQLNDHSFIAHLQKRHAAAMDHSFMHYLYFEPFPLYGTDSL